MSLTADNTIASLYFNGIQVKNLPNANNWEIADTVLLPPSTNIIAIQLQNVIGTPAGFLASSSNNCILTNGLWKCTSLSSLNLSAPAMSPYWFTINYNDSSWPSAKFDYTNGQGYWNEVNVSSISPDAYWVWAASEANDTSVVCRLYI